jgi:Pyruvate/2-oxoacid:ferredoxin oxidoreductase delta subunit
MQKTYIKPTVNYNAYITSAKWRAKRWVVGLKSNFICRMCHRYCRDNFEVHHKTYRNLGHEPMTDLMCLCTECHKKVELAKKVKKMEQKAKWARYAK